MLKAINQSAGARLNDGRTSAPTNARIVDEFRMSGIHRTPASSENRAKLKNG